MKSTKKNKIQDKKIQISNVQNFHLASHCEPEGRGNLYAVKCYEIASVVSFPRNDSIVLPLEGI